MPPGSDPTRHQRHFLAKRIQPYALALGVVVVALLLAFVADRLVPHPNLSLVFLTGVLIVAAQGGLGPSLFASLLSLLAYAFFFTPPYHSFGVAADSDAATLAFFLIVAAVTGHLAARMHREMASNRASLVRLSKLYAFGARLSAAADTEAVLHALTYHMERCLTGTVAVMLTESDNPPVLRQRIGPLATPTEAEIATVWANPSLEVSDNGEWRFLRLSTNRGALGLVAIESECVDAEQLDLARSLCDQAALALDRIRLAADVEQAKLVSETEQLRSALLSSVSHDLRTPLASIIGSTTSLLEYGEAISPDYRTELLRTAVDDAQRLDRYIQNLLDMTRLGHGKLRLRCDWVDVNDVVSGAVGRSGASAKGLRLDIHVASDAPLLWVQGVLLEQALVNVLDNAIRFSPVGGRIEIAARRDGETVEIEVCDEGPGIPETEREKVFDMFYTLRDADHSHLAGTGLGLAICRGLVAAHQGRVTARARGDENGTCIRLVLPIVRSDPTPESP